MTTDKFRELVDEHTLRIKGLTGSLNGYPEPDLGYAAYGFKSYKEAKAFASKTGGKIIDIFFRDGWGYARHEGSRIVAPRVPTPDEFGDDYHVATHPLNDFANFVAFGSEEEARESMGDDWVDKAKPLYEEALKELEHVDFESGEAALFKGLHFVDTINPMYYSHDTKHYAVAVAFEFNEQEDADEQ